MSNEDETQALPWRELMAFGLGELKLAPEVFWAMSLPELNAALRGARPHLNGVGQTSLSVENFVDLMTKFPD